MTSPLDDYKSLIDDLVALRGDVQATRITDADPWPETSGRAQINRFVESLDAGERATLAALLNESRDGGIHDVLVYLRDETNNSGLKLVRNGHELPAEPFGTGLHYDWVCRGEGDDWPTED